MGLIRKTLAVGTVGVVRPSSKKQRNQKKLIKESRTSNKFAAAQLQVQLRAQALAHADAQLALASAQAQNAALMARVQQPQQGVIPPLPPQNVLGGPGIPAGWYNDPSGTPGLRYYDGTNWTENTAPFAIPSEGRPKPGPAAQ